VSRVVKESRVRVLEELKGVTCREDVEQGQEVLE